MKKGVFFLSATLAAAVMILLVVCVTLILGYRFSSADSLRYGSVYYYGTKDSGTVYTPDGKMTDYPKKHKLVYENGDVYEGEIRGYLPNGQGVYTSAYGEVIDGEFSDGVADGFCRVTLTGGNRYEGLLHAASGMKTVFSRLCTTMARNCRKAPLSTADLRARLHIPTEAGQTMWAVTKTVCLTETAL